MCVCVCMCRFHFCRSSGIRAKHVRMCRLIGSLRRVPYKRRNCSCGPGVVSRLPKYWEAQPQSFVPDDFNGPLEHHTVIHLYCTAYLRASYLQSVSEFLGINTCILAKSLRWKAWFDYCLELINELLNRRATYQGHRLIKNSGCGVDESFDRISTPLGGRDIIRWCPRPFPTSTG